MNENPITERIAALFRFTQIMDRYPLRRSLHSVPYPVTYENFEGVTHEFFGMGAVVDKAKQAVSLAGLDLTKAFNSGPSAALRFRYPA